MAREPFNEIWANDPDPAQFEEPPTDTFETGWEGGADKDPPQAKWENWWHNRVDVALQDIERGGAMGWHADAEYEENALSLSPLNDLYASQASQNIGNNPDTDGGSNWLRIAFGRATDTVFGFFRKATQSEVDNGSTDEAAVTPEKLRLGVSYKLSDSGYLALPTWLGGIIIQWGTAIINETTSFPIEFPNQCFQAVASDNIDPVPHAMGVGFTSSSIEINSDESSGGSCRYIAIGH